MTTLLIGCFVVTPLLLFADSSNSDGNSLEDGAAFWVHAGAYQITSECAHSGIRRVSDSPDLSAKLQKHFQAQRSDINDNIDNEENMMSNLAKDLASEAHGNSESTNVDKSDALEEDRLLMKFFKVLGTLIVPKLLTCVRRLTIGLCHDQTVLESIFQQKN